MTSTTPADKSAKSTAQGYHAYRKENNKLKGANVPGGIEGTMTLTSVNDLKVAFEMLDDRKDGVLDRTQARNWLRCAGWCLPDEDLDQILSGTAPGSPKKLVTTERTKWGLKQLMDLLEQNGDRDNTSVAQLQQALRRLANNRAKISRERVLEFVSQDQDLKEEDLDQVLGALGLGSAKLLDCDSLAVKLLDRVCNPPSVLELHEMGK
mmetsp:Transcript_33694/g.60980  ORF Transcript_33694/g.60980 Transcript_33694/m.60980 type:complete len:208 (-) Transcript_33694:189-812(-)|eukprot:CAMPEP_0197628294 /NCGR_PEP_ID=MMETSP1338-20131121/6654_1 /TAXON_ID=43686 ORGANISM="Pelagodinium beii, Strain RCC1491" /NCGR_SAMPLE_ID=MMETSP1338 /ASSEMBLY_ACC=CAM_ASM_000754 /LENGTH=207 /DNA_ID=CAMNT_0043199247 /DNA_START=54 /DNA_END=677 /DNA_ORIENTATION=-